MRRATAAALPADAGPRRRRLAAGVAALGLVAACGAEAQQAGPRAAPAAKPAQPAAVAAAPAVGAAPQAAAPRSSGGIEAAGGGGGGGGGGGDGSGGGQPIEIQADRLVVDQEREIATFSGNVDAVQGELSLRADLLRVFYADEGEQQGQRPAGGGAGAADAQGIRRIEAEGDVLLRQPGETAEGDAGVYDPVAGTMVLEGNVVLTRGQNVVRGTRLDSDLNTGVSVVTAAPAAGRGQRVRALFSPERGGEEGAAGP